MSVISKVSYAYLVPVPVRGPIKTMHNYIIRILISGDIPGLALFSVHLNKIKKNGKLITVV